MAALAFLAVYGYLCFMALSRHPIFGLAAYLCAFYVHPPSRWWGASLPSLRWSLLAALLTLVAVVMHERKLLPKPRFLSNFPVNVLIVFTLYLAVQMAWSIWPEQQQILLLLYAKYCVLVYLIYRIVDTEKALRIFLWAVVLGGFCLGVVAFERYTGGRFEGFGGAGIGEANVGGLTLVMASLAAGALFLTGNVWEKIGITICGVFIMNGIVTTQSRSTFLALAVGGLVFYLLSPSKHRWLLRVFAIVGLAGFVSLTNPLYWARMASLQHAGEKVEGMETGSGRIVLMKAQLRMFQSNVFGHGHRGTAALSRIYLDDVHLTGSGENRARSSHNTTLTVLVEHGLPGVVLWACLAVWSLYAVFVCWRTFRRREGLLAMMPALLGALFVGLYVSEQFVDYLKLEARAWFIAILIVCLQWARSDVPATRTAPDRPQGRRRFVVDNGGKAQDDAGASVVPARRRFTK